MKLRFGRTGQAEPLPSGRLVTSLDAPPAPASQAPEARHANEAPPVSSEDLDALAARVLERLAQSPLPESLVRIVTEVSERLVREEIARIREKSRTPPGSGA